MAICNASCAVSIPCPLDAGCSIQTRAGGIKQFAIVKCSYTFADISDREEWEAAITAGNAVISGQVLGQKPKGTFTKKRISSCSPESIVGAEKQITFQDYNVGNVYAANAHCAAYNFWNTVLTEASSYQFGYITCDNLFYGLVTDFQIEIDEVIEDNNTGSTYFDGTILWNQVQMICPTYVDLTGLSCD